MLAARKDRYLVQVAVVPFGSDWRNTNPFSITPVWALMRISLVLDELRARGLERP